MKKHIVLSLLFAAGSLMSCSEKEILEVISFEDPITSYLQGDTSSIRRSLDSKYFQRFNDIRNSKFAIVLHDTIVKFEGVRLHGQPAQASDLSNLKTGALKGKPLEYVAFGSSLTAGVRDGGYYNEGILTAYPELIARQMRLENFKSPVFESSDYNGIGRKVITTFNPTQGAIKKYAVVTNNTGIERYDEKLSQPILKKSRYTWEELNNAAIPGYRYAVTDPEFHKSSDIYKARFNSSNVGMGVGKREFDFFTYESCSAGFTSGGSLEAQAFMMQSDPNRFPTPFENFLDGFMHQARERKLNGVFLNLPNHNYFPAYWQIPCGTIEKNSNNVIISSDCRNGYVYGNTSRLDSIASPKVSLNLKTHNWQNANGLGQYNYSLSSYNSTDVWFDYFNRTQKELGKKYGFPVVELDKVYEKILNDTYITDDGIKADPRLHGGNFFSSDGLYPTAFGHAIIANEIIKVVNAHYKTRIPLINTREYLK